MLPIRQGGMEYTRASTLWKCMKQIIQPNTINVDDITEKKIEHTQIQNLALQFWSSKD